MDRQAALTAARQLIPNQNQPLRFDDSRLHLNARLIERIDTDRNLNISQAELTEALVKDLVMINPTSKQVVIHPLQVNLFLDDALATEPVNPRKAGPTPFRSEYGGASTLGISRPGRDQLLVEASPAFTGPERGLDDLVGKLKTPGEVAGLLDAINYDTERGKALGGDGPLGTQTPEDTLSDFSGVCRDIHQLGAYILNQNGYDAVQVGYVANRTSHSVLAYADGNGYGVIEYGRVYAPEDIAKLLGRPALSPREAISALRPEAKVIFGWTPPKLGEEGSVKSIFYTMGHRLYQESLKLKHQDRLEVDRLRGVEIEKTLGEHWSIKAGVNFDSPADPTAAGAAHVAVGYQWGDFDNFGRVSLGVQHRPNEGAHVVGPNTWKPNPTTLAGVSIEGKVTPFKYEFGPRLWTSTTVHGQISGAFLALNHDKASDAGVIKDGAYGLDSDYLTGLPAANLRLSQNFGGKLSDNLSFRSELFVDNDVFLSAAAYGMGGKDFYANIGANGKLIYENGPFGAHVGAQYLFKQVNNNEATGVTAGVSYTTGRVSIGAGGTVFKSEEGVRLQTQQTVNLKIAENASLYAGAQQETIFHSSGNYSNPGSTNFMGGLKFDF
ncbi:MAG: hypothetical protein CVV27_13505 [Candidatus Melainabacteria bacterium HGW-Melainabacteria-1]|nr:MAG: hypothetical protein CVV27_13505 [Candidatus Melainabacteria bacterium HGW-Melainabacteria-1]